MNDFWCIPVMNFWLAQAAPALGVPSNVQLVPTGFFAQLAVSLPRFLGAFVLLVVGFVVALLAKSIVRDC